MRHEIEVKMIEIKKTTALTSSSAFVQGSELQRSEFILSDLDIETRIEKAIGAVELFDSNLMDGHSLQEKDFTENMEQRIKVSLLHVIICAMLMCLESISMYNLRHFLIKYADVGVMKINF